MTSRLTIAIATAVVGIVPDRGVKIMLDVIADSRGSVLPVRRNIPSCTHMHSF